MPIWPTISRTISEYLLDAMVYLDMEKLPDKSLSLRALHKDESVFGMLFVPVLSSPGPTSAASAHVCQTRRIFVETTPADTPLLTLV